MPSSSSSSLSTTTSPTSQTSTMTVDPRRPLVYIAVRATSNKTSDLTNNNMASDDANNNNVVSCQCSLRALSSQKYRQTTSKSLRFRLTFTRTRFASLNAPPSTATPQPAGRRLGEANETSAASTSTSSVDATPTTKACTICGKFVAAQSLAVHELTCGAYGLTRVPNYPPP